MQECDLSLVLIIKKKQNKKNTKTKESARILFTPNFGKQKFPQEYNYRIHLHLHSMVNKQGISNSKIASFIHNSSHEYKSQQPELSILRARNCIKNPIKRESSFFFHAFNIQHNARLFRQLVLTLNNWIMPLDIALSVIKQKYTTSFIKWLNRTQEVIRAIKCVRNWGIISV